VPPAIHLQLTNSLDDVATVAAAIDEVVAGLGLDALDADRIQTAAAEACKNVVLHAYEGTEGPMDVRLSTAPGAVEVAVLDQGIGIRPHLGERHYPHNGLGLPIIHQHAQRITYTNLPGGGTEVRMEFGVEARRDPPPGELAGAVLGRLAHADDRAQVLVSIEGEEDAGRVLEGAREALGQSRDRLAAERRAAGEGGPELLVLSLPVGG